MSEWKRMDNKEVHESGLLWRINEAVLWPLGLALTVVKEDGVYEPGLFIQATEPFSPIWSGATDEETDEHADRFAAWMKQRLG